MKVLGVSGGVDSMLMLDMMKNQDIVVAHVNHGYREQSKEEYKMVQEICRKMNVPFEGIELHLTDDREHIAREARYEFYEKVMKKYSSNELYLGHHADDLLETFIMNIGRNGLGTALIGMTEASWSQNKKYQIKRPLLRKTKQEIYKEAKEKNIQWMEDATNQEEDKYLRNKVRHHIVPTLKEVFPMIEKSVLNITQEKKEIEDFFEAYIEEKKEKMEMQEGVYKVEKSFLKERKIIRKKMLKKIIKEMTGEKVKNNIYEDIEEKINTKAINTDFQKIKENVWIVVDRECFYLMNGKIKRKIEEETEDAVKIKKKILKNKKVPKAFRKSVKKIEESIFDYLGNKY